MAVSTSVILPAQPTTAGSVTRVPLGGNGHTAPQALYTFSVNLDCDASGGQAIIHVRMDPRYSGLVSYLNVQVDSATADKVIGVLIKAKGGDSLFQTLNAPYLPQGAAASNTLLCLPPPLVLPAEPSDGTGSDFSYVRSSMLNVDGETLRMNGRMFVFDSRVRELTPYPMIVDNLPGL